MGIHWEVSFPMIFSVIRRIYPPHFQWIGCTKNMLEMRNHLLM